MLSILFLLILLHCSCFIVLFCINIYRAQQSAIVIIETAADEEVESAIHSHHSSNNGGGNINSSSSIDSTNTRKLYHESTSNTTTTTSADVPDSGRSEYKPMSCDSLTRPVAFAYILCAALIIAHGASGFLLFRKSEYIV